MHVYKLSDLISFSFLKIPKTLFANPAYKAMSSDAKLAYALLYDRLSLSKKNSWINEKNEVYQIYTRKELAEDLGISYKKAISAFHELTEAELISEKRCGRGMANRIFIAKPEITENNADDYTENDTARPDETVCLNEDKTADQAETVSQELPYWHIKNCGSDRSKTAETAHQELPKRHPIKTDLINTDLSYTDFSQSVFPVRYHLQKEDGWTDEQQILDEILENCQLMNFDKDVQKIFCDAIERLYYCEHLRVGNSVLPRDKVRIRLRELDYSMLDAALYQLHQNKDKPVKNMTAYVMSTVFNAITESYSVLHIDPYLNAIRG